MSESPASQSIEKSSPIPVSKKPAASKVKSGLAAHPRRTPKQIEALEDRADAEVVRHRLATNDPSQNRTLDDLRKALGR